MAGDIRIAVIGLGKIARDQHLPAIAGSRDFTLAAIASPTSAPVSGVPFFSDYRTMLAQGPAFDAVAICTPPGPRPAIARDCIAAGCAVLLEKPPAATLGEAEALGQFARMAGVPLFAAWHAQHNPAVEMAASIAHAEGVSALVIRWLEDVETWHPGQEWIWQPGGLGVFDAGINALSIATRLVDAPLVVRSATMTVQAGRTMPAAATLRLVPAGRDSLFDVRFDWRHTGEPHWTLDLTTRKGSRLYLDRGGARLSVDGRTRCEADEGEYPALYRHFARIVREGGVELDLAPLRLVADAFLLARRQTERGARTMH